MNKSKAYRRADVNNVKFEELAQKAAGRGAAVGMDVGKHAVLCVVRWPDGQFERPWKVNNPSEIPRLAGLLRSLAQRCPLRAAMEPTGTYGDPLRAELARQGLPLYRVGGKASHDYAEIFDGVPSQHDGKDAAVVAELAAIGKCRPWPYREPSEEEAELNRLVAWPWFEAKKAKDKGRGQGALLAVARKLMLALYAVAARGETFDVRRLLPGAGKTRAVAPIA